MARLQPPLKIFFTPENLGALPALWLQAKLTISLAPFQEKFAKPFQTERTIQRHSRYLPGVARSMTIRVAERLALSSRKVISSRSGVMPVSGPCIDS